MNKSEINGDFNDRSGGKPLSYQIIGAAIAVHSWFGAGLLESLYEEALCIELSNRRIRFEQQKRIEVEYKGHDVGLFVADLVVDGRIIVEVKAVQALAPIHTAQLITYLKLLNLKTGLLINFNVPKLAEGIKRVVL
ncbi:MAG: GxxExxY protein [Chloroflexi bacterium]|nr:GxxExxY protein [Chloroflexota bacterium]